MTKAIDAASSAVSTSSSSEVAAVVGQMTRFFARQNLGPVRFFCPASNAFGHMSATLVVLKRLCDLCGLSTAQLVCEDADVLEKLCRLLPQARTTAGESFPVYSGAKVVTCTTLLLAAASKTPATLAVTGGLDATVKKMAGLREKLGVAAFVALQPYLWSSEDTHAVDAVCTASMQSPLNLDEVDKCLPLAVPAQPTPQVTGAEWDLLATTPAKAVTAFARAVLGAVGSTTNRLFCPVYGMNDAAIPGGTAPSPSVGLFNLCAGIRAAQNAGQRFAHPVVVLAIGAFKETSWTRLQQSVDGTDTFLSSTAASFAKAQMKGKVLVRPDVTDPAGAVTCIQALQPDQVLVLQVGALPMSVFNLVYGSATFPCVFEGAGTAGLLANLGKPFFRFGGTAYPPLPPSPLHVGPASGLGDEAVRMLRLGPTSWPSDDDRTPPVVIAEFARRAVTPNDPIATYFTQRAALATDPTWDKVFRAFRHLFTDQQLADVFGGDTSRAASAADVDPVTQVYEALEANLSAGTLNVVPGAFGDGPIAGLLGAAGGGGLVLSDATVTKPTDGQVAATGTASLFGVSGLDVALVFTDPPAGLLAGVVATLPQSWAFANAPWLTFKDVTFRLTRPATDAAPSGSVAGGVSLADTDMRAEVLLPDAAGLWVVTFDFGRTPPGISSLFQLVGGINLAKALPPPLDAFSDLGVEHLELAYDTAAQAITSFTGRVGTTRPWPLFGNVVLDDLRISLFVTNPGDVARRTTRFLIEGGFAVGPGRLVVTVGVPGLVFSGTLRPPADPEKHVTLGDVASLFLPQGQTVPLGGNIERLDFVYDRPAGSWGVGCTVDAEWKIPEQSPIFVVKQVGFSVTGDAAAVAGSITGTIDVPQDATDPSKDVVVQVSASYATATKWTIEGRQSGAPFDVIALLAHYLDWKTDRKLEITDLAVQIATGNGTWMFTGRVGGWDPPFVGGTLDGRLTLGKATSGTFARVEADWRWENIDLRAWYDYDPDVQKFGISWGKLEGKVTERPKDKGGGYTATLSFDDEVTLGWIIETMVSWLTGSTFGLEAPWNLLDKVPLSKLALVYTFGSSEPADNGVSFGIDIGPIELGFARIDGIQVGYRSTGPDAGVMVTLTGSFPFNVGTSATGDTGTLGPWDTSKPGTAPAPPGGGNKYLDLRLLAMGQHVTVTGLAEADTVQKAIAAMAALPPPQGASIPPVVFDPTTSWLVGTEFGVLRLTDGSTPAPLPATTGGATPPSYFLTLQLVFDDPHLYALRVALAGAPAKIFKGLDFQVMYRQLSDSVGVYQAELTLPDAMRQLSIGVYSITLPVFGIAVYTNGDFLLDVGFPWQQNFSRSFTIQGIVYPGIPVLGSAGLYFGKLSSATTDKVPAATNGTFNPVIVFGFGLQVGVGKTVQYGVLSGGFSVTLVGILEGVLAKWNPYALPSGGEGDDAQLQTAYYFALQGAVGIQGKLFGTVDFSVVKADVNVSLQVLLQLSYESYVSLSFSVIASVDIAVTVQINLGIFKIKLHFSFSARIKETLTLENHGTPPWQVAGGATTRPLAPTARRLRAARRPAALPGARRQVQAPQWANLTAPAAPTDLTGWVVLGLSVAADEWEDDPALTDQQPVYAAMLLIESTEASTAAAPRLRAGPDTVESSFEALADMVFRWVIAAVQPAPLSAAEVDALVVSDDQLLDLLEHVLVSTDDNPTPVPPDAASAFMAAQFRMHTNVPGPGATPVASYFPVPPELRLVLSPYGDDYPGYDYTFGAYNTLSADGLRELRAYFAELLVQVEEEARAPTTAAGGGPGPLSCASWLFADYFLLMARQLVQAARDGLRDFKYELSGTESAADVVAWLVATGDLGPDGYTTAELLAGNTSHPLQPGVAVTVGATPALTEPSSIAALAEQWDVPASALAAANAVAPDVAATGTVVTGPGGKSHPVGEGESLADVAAAFKLRFADFLAETDVLTVAGLLAVDATVVVPVVTYQVQSGDTFTSVAGTPAYGGGFDGATLATANAAAPVLATGARVSLPNGEPYVVQPRDSLVDVARALGAPLDAVVQAVVQATGLLAPAAVLGVPTFDVAARADDTLQAVADGVAVPVAVLCTQARNGTQAGLFAATVSDGSPLFLDVPHLPQFEVGALLAEARRTLAVQQLAGMASRYFLHGLRLPTAGITPATPGMWVHGSAPGPYTLPPAAGLSSLTGQQFPLPVLGAEQAFTVTFDASDGPAWLVFPSDGDAATATTLAVEIAPDSLDAARLAAVTAYAQSTRLSVSVVDEGDDTMAGDAFATFPFTSSLLWQSDGPATLPYGAAPAGVPALRVWQVPGSMAAVPRPGGPYPRFDVELARYDEATGGTVVAPAPSYGWATTLAFTVKRLPPGATSPVAQTTYEVLGAGGADVALLERLLDALGADDGAIATLVVGYQPDQAGATTAGFQTDRLDGVTTGIAQVNLSTETRPPSGGGAVPTADEDVPLNTPTSFLRLLWEASITGGSGFYLYYWDAVDGRGLPDRIFDGNGEAVLTLVVVYAKPEDSARTDEVSDFVNAVVTAGAVDTSDTVVFAEAKPVASPVDLAARPSLAAMAAATYSDVGDLAVANATVTLTAGLPLTVRAGTYQAPPGGIALADVADQFGTTVDALNAANRQWPDGLPDPLPFPTAVFLPALTVSSGSGPTTTTLGAVAAAYGEDVRVLAVDNADVAGLFDPSGHIVVPGGPRVRSATVPVGVEALAFTRPVPPAVPDDPDAPGFAELFLLNTYTLLAYRVAESPFFTGSNIGLPAGPTTTPADPTNADKVRLPRVLEPGDTWFYRQALPYTRFLRPSDDGDGTNPYAAVGAILQVALDWVDYFGNRLVTTLSDPRPGDTGMRTEAPRLTGYVDPLVGLSQWPAVSSDWRIASGEAGAELALRLSFDATRYDGVLAAAATSTTSVTVQFTTPLDPGSATEPDHYTISPAVAVSSVTLAPDGMSVVLTTGAPLADGTYTVTVSGVRDTNGRTVAGQARFAFPDDPTARSSTVQQTAAHDLRLWSTLQQQLADPHGCVVSVVTSLLVDDDGGPGRITVDGAQLDALLAWLFTGNEPAHATAVLAFVADRAAFGTSVAPPPPACTVTEPLPEASRNQAQIFRLSTSLCLTRTGGRVLPALATTPGIVEAVTVVPAGQEAADGSSTMGTAAFARAFQEALSSPGEFLLQVATGVDRAEPDPSPATATLWAVRLGCTAEQGISFAITEATDGNPAVFAPRPASNQLQSRTAVPIYDYTTGEGISRTATRHLDFDNIDLDTWCAQVFTAVDGVLTPEYTAAIQLVDAFCRTHHLADLLGAKKAVADRVKLWMVPVFHDDDTDASNVQEDFYQQLLVRLSGAYTTRAAVEYAATVNADVHEPVATQPPRLFGDVRPPGAVFASATVSPADPTDVVLTFDTSLAEAPATTLGNYSVSGGVTVTAVVLSDDGSAVTLSLSGPAVAGTTTVTIAHLTDVTGAPVPPPLTRTVEAGAAAAARSTLAFGASKLDLQTGDARPLSFLVSGPELVRDAQGAVVDHLTVPLRYMGSTIEHQIGTVEGIEGYTASTWLSFVLPEAAATLAADLGDVRLPLPLRAYPATPTLVGQEGRPSPDGDAGDDPLAAALAWRYSFTYALPYHYPQDEVHCRVEFNVTDVVAGPDAEDDTFAQLAEFVTVFPEVQADLVAYLAAVDATSSGTSPTVQDAKVAVGAFVQLVQGVAGTPGPDGARPLVVDAPPPRRTGEADLTFSFTVREAPVTHEGETSVLAVTLTGALPVGMGDPLVLVDPDAYDCVPVDGEQGTYRFVYQAKDGAGYLSAAAGQAIGARTVVLPGLNLFQRQDACATTWVERNGRLVPGRRTAAPFVYTTPEVQAPDPLHPSNDSTVAVDVGRLPASGTTLADRIEALFTALLAGNVVPELTFQVEVTYAYALNPTLAPVVLPVLFQAPLTVTVAGDGGGVTLAQMEADWVTGMTAWFDAMKPSCGGTIGFDLTVLSNLTARPVPLVRLERLFLDLADVSDLPCLPD